MSRAAVDLALAVFKDPGLLADLRERPVPDDIGQVIRIAAGENAAREAAAASTGAAPEEIVEACVFFLQQTLFAPGGDSYRVLGSRTDDPQERLREHYRWLMKWLHPDRNQDGWETLYADRVNAAWQDLKTPDRRAEYDLRLPSAPQSMVPVPQVNWRVPMAEHAPRGPLLSGRIVRNLPAIVLGTLAAGAMLVVGATYWARTATEREWAAREDARDRTPAEATALQQARAEISPVVVPASPERPAAEASDAGTAAADVAPAWDDDPSAAASVAESTAASAAVATPVVAVSTPSATVAEPPAPVAQAAAAPAEPPPAAVAPVPAVLASTTTEGPVTAATRIEPETPAIALQPPPDAAPVTSNAVASKPVPPNTDIAGSAVPASSAPVPAPVAPAIPPVSQAVADVGARPEPATPTPEVEPAPDSVSGSSPALAEIQAAESRIPVETQPVPAVVKSPEPAGIAPARASAEALVREFIAAYAAGDRGRFDRLLSTGGRGQTTLLDMRRRLDTTDMRFLEITQVQWQLDSESARASASYRDTYVPRGARKAVTEAGRIDWDIRIEDGDHRIAGIERNVRR